MVCFFKADFTGRLIWTHNSSLAGFIAPVNSDNGDLSECSGYRKVKQKINTNNKIDPTTPVYLAYTDCLSELSKGQLGALM